MKRLKKEEKKARQAERNMRTRDRYCKDKKNEPPHDKTNKITVWPAKNQISLGMCPVWSESSLCSQWLAKDPSFLHADIKDSDQTGWMPRLIWVFAGCTVILLVLSCGGSNSDTRKTAVITWILKCEKSGFAIVSLKERSDLIWVYTVCPDLSVKIFRIINELVLSEKAKE